MTPDKKKRKDARRKLYSLMCKISEDYYYAGWFHNLEFILWGYVTVYRNKQSYEFRSSTYTEKVINHIPDLSNLSRSAGGWFAFGVDYTLFIEQGRWNKIFAKSREAAKRAIENYDKSLDWRKKEARLEKSKWYRWRNKQGHKYKRRIRRERNRSWKKYCKYGMNSFTGFASMALPLVRRFNYQEIGAKALHIEPLPPTPLIKFNWENCDV